MKVEIAGVEVTELLNGEIVRIAMNYKGRTIVVCLGELNRDVEESGVVNHWSGEREGVHMMNVLIDGEQAISMFAANPDTFKCENPVGIEIMDCEFEEYNSDGCTHNYIAKG